jgi:hypothetical protein
MTKFLAGVLSVIAVGVLLIAYGLLNPPVAAYADQAPFARPMLANETMMLRDNPNAMYVLEVRPIRATRTRRMRTRRTQYQPVAAPVRT